MSADDTGGDRYTADAFGILTEYERRSLAHVAGLPEQLQAAGLWRGIGFRVGQRRLVSSYEAVAEILTVPQITPVPGGHAWMLGVANVRSNLLPVVDLKQFLEGARSVLHEGHQKVMVLRQPGGDVAVTIDELYGQRSFMDEQQVEPEGLIDGRYVGFIDRAYRVADGVWGVFSLSRLVRTPEFRHAAV
jgi:twitching motility protein PilI